MRIVAVDDEELALENILSLLHKVEPGSEIFGFTEVDDMIDYLAHHPVDVAFLDIELGDFNGMKLAKLCQEACPQVNVIFVTGYSEYTVDAFRLRASGYLMKPVREQDLRMELENLRNPLGQPEKKPLRVQTFGFFEVFVNDRPLKFPRSKCKECLAYLVDRRGAQVTYPDLSSILWEDRPYDRAVQNNTQRVISDLVKTLKEVGLEHVILRGRQGIAVDPLQLDCDYYQALSIDGFSRLPFTGEYMSNYSWAELTLGKFEKNKNYFKNKSI